MEKINIICKDCNNILRKRSKFCPNCGIELIETNIDIKTNKKYDDNNNNYNIISLLEWDTEYDYSFDKIKVL